MCLHSDSTDIQINETERGGGVGGGGVRGGGGRGGEGEEIQKIYSFRPLRLMKGCRWMTYHFKLERERLEFESFI